MILTGIEATGVLDTALTSLQESAAAQRALDYYLKPDVLDKVAEERFFDVNHKISKEDALVHASELMRCAAAIACESASNLQGASRDLAFSTVHMIDMARAMVERALTCDQNR